MDLIGFVNLKGGPNGHPRPIEIHAHDHYRYVSDMAAWIHQALASETELISALLAKTQLRMCEHLFPTHGQFLRKRRNIVLKLSKY